MLQSFAITPGTGKTHLATGLGITAANHGHRVLFATATDWVTRLTDVHRTGKLSAELTRLRHYGLIIIDLCRHRDYAEASGRDGSWPRRLAVGLSA